MIKEFIIKDGLTVPAVTKEQMIDVDSIAVEETRPILFQMMENTGRNLALTVIDLIKENSSGRKVLIFAGRGVNGGDRICAAKHYFTVDAIIGYSLSSAPRGKVLEMINFINKNNIPAISLDIPTGVLATSGENLGEFVKPEITLTLALPKKELYPDKCGEIILADIGIPQVVYEKIALKYNLPFSDKYIIPISVKE